MNQELKRKLQVYVAVFLSICVAFIICYSHFQQAEVRSRNIQSVMKLILVGILFGGSFLMTQKKQKGTILLQSIIIAGMVMRIGYMLYTPCTLRQHDLGLMSIQGNGHAAYIFKILSGKLPSSNAYQFYHPPLFHVLAALLVKVMSPFMAMEDGTRGLEAAKIVSCFASCCVVFLTKEICEALRLKERATLFVVGLIAFLPYFYLLAGRINNDSLALFFMVLILLYTIKWYEEPRVKYIIILAMGFGLGMMTKLSVGIMAFLTGSVMLVQAVKWLEKGLWCKAIKQYGLFSLITYPMALWYPLRNYIYFKQPLTYVFEGKDPKSIVCDSFSFFQRFISFDFTKLLSPVYNDPFNDHALSMYLLKGALFGEFQLGEHMTSQILILLYALINMVIIGTMILLIIYGKKMGIWRVLLPGMYFLNDIVMIVFNMRYPYPCTMDFRYIMTNALFGALFIGIVSEWIEEKQDRWWVKAYKWGFTSLLICFSLASVSLYCNL